MIGRDRRRARRLPRRRLRDRRPHRFRRLGVRQPAAEPAARRGGAGGAAVRRPAAARASPPAATARPSRSPTTPPPEGRAAEPPHRLHARRAGAGRRGRRAADGAGDRHALRRAHHRHPAATPSIQFAAGSATIAPESAPVVAAIQEVLADLPRGGAGDRRPHRLAGLGVGQPAPQPASAPQAVLAALRDADLPLPARDAPAATARAEPVADNATLRGPGAEPPHHLHRGGGHRGGGHGDGR